MKIRLSAFLTPALSATALPALLDPLLAFAQQPAAPQQPLWNCAGSWHMGQMGYGGWEHGWMFPMFMWLAMIVIAGVIIFYLSHRSGGTQHRWGPWHMMGHPSGPGRAWGDPTHSALQILGERFAKGEIQKPEYEEKKAAILSGGHH